MEMNPNPQRPEGDFTEGQSSGSNLTRTLAGILIGAVLSAGVLLGALWALDRADKPTPNAGGTGVTSEFEAEKARVNLWFAGAVRPIATTIELFRNLNPEDVKDPKKFAELCTSLEDRVTELDGITEAPLPDLDKIYREWVTTVGLVQKACVAGDIKEFERQLGISDADFTRFDSAVAPYIPEAPNTPEPAPSQPAAK